MHETKMHEQNCFVTLTYNPKNLPANGTLVVDDVQRFLKRLRKKLEPKKIRFFLCGEYGEKLARPHYHLIIFGHDFEDKKEVSGGVNPLFESETLDKIWGLADPGMCKIGSVTFESACYVANYATKKITNKHEYRDVDGRIWPSADQHYQGRKPEFLCMSRRPGVGKTWYEKFNGDVFPSDEVIVRGKTARPPRYYSNLYKESEPEKYEKIKARREAAADHLEKWVYKGQEIEIAPSRNARRLVVRAAVAKAKLAEKNRKLEKLNT